MTGSPSAFLGIDSQTYGHGEADGLKPQFLLVGFLGNSQPVFSKQRSKIPPIAASNATQVAVVFRFQGDFAMQSLKQKRSAGVTANIILIITSTHM